LLLFLNREDSLESEHRNKPLGLPLCTDQYQQNLQEKLAKQPPTLANLKPVLSDGKATKFTEILKAAEIIYWIMLVAIKRGKIL